jgi:hypothetical protein
VHAESVCVVVRRLLHLDQNYRSGIANGKPAFSELAPVLREAVPRGEEAVV